MHDSHAYLLGICAIGLVCMAYEHVSQLSLMDVDLIRASKLLARCLGWISTLVLLPFLAGYCLELYAVRSVSGKSAVWEVWGMGVMGLRIFWNIVDMTDSSYKREMDRMRNEGWTDDLFLSLVMPVFSRLIVGLALPLGVLQALPKGEEEVERWKSRIVFGAAVGIAGSHAFGRVLGARLRVWLDSVRDEQFLIGRRLHNYE